MTRCFDLNKPPSELEKDLRVLDSSTLANVRQALFQEARTLSLTGEGSALVQRRKTNGGESVKQKHVADIIVLVRSIQNKSSVPRTVLRNGKRSAEEWHASQSRTSNSAVPDIDLPLNVEPDTQPPVAQPGTVQTHDRVGADDKIFWSTVVGDIGLLKNQRWMHCRS